MPRYGARARAPDRMKGGFVVGGNARALARPGLPCTERASTTTLSGRFGLLERSVVALAGECEHFCRWLASSELAASSPLGSL